ncbi:carbohydrate-binding protein [Thiosocius teredinicola]|uniref:carbohydrate-binding protein n=1 Tax=Thiosocius teredinicola TaxID=1973002 RepID=UPI002FE4630B
MQKRKISHPSQTRPDAESSVEQDWLDLSTLAEVELTSEDPDHPIEAAFARAGGEGWRAGAPGPQLIRLIFFEPLRVRHIRVRFDEAGVERTQQYVLRHAAQPGEACREIVRQQWNFNPRTAPVEVEDHAVDLPATRVLELEIDPDMGDPSAFASLSRLQVA